MIGTLVFAAAATIAVGVELVPATSGISCRGELHAATGAREVSEAIAGTRGTVILEPGDWTLTLESQECWSTAVAVKVPAEGTQDPVRVPVWRRAEFAGSLAVRSGELPDHVRVEIRAGGTLSRTQTCPVTAGVWRCAGPLTSTDVRLQAERFAPVYFWGVGGADAVTTLPRATLQQGGSIIGWVVAPDGTPAADAEVNVAADTFAGRSPVQFATTEAAVRTNARGFFQFSGLPPGSYNVSARTAAKDASEADGVEVSDARESIIPRLALEAPATVDVALDPAVTPDGSPWLVALDRMGRDGITRGQPTPSSEAGRWEHKTVERGPYRLRVLDRHGSLVHRRELQVDRDFVPLQIAIGLIPVEGRVRAGAGEPLAAELRFQAAHGTVEMQSDEEGRFTGWLPAEGKWEVQVTPKGGVLRVRIRVPVRLPPNATRATVDIDLPKGVIRGRVEDRSGKPVAQAAVVAMRGTEVLANLTTKADGSFLMFGLTDGDVLLSAKTRTLESGKIPYTVSPGTEAEVVLVLAPSNRLAGRVRQTNGTPIAGALIRVLVGGVIRSDVSGPRGDFELKLPPGAPFADLAVLAPALPVKIARVPVDEDALDLVVSERPGLLRIRLRANSRGWPMVRRDAAALPLQLLLMPAEGFGIQEADGDTVRIGVEPGTYSVCYRDATACPAYAVAAGTIVEIETGDRSREGGER